MYPISSYELAKARVADTHRQAQRDALARAARRARRGRAEQRTDPVTGRTAGTLARRALTLLGARSA
jgi:hypothetical protein